MAELFGYLCGASTMLSWESGRLHLAPLSRASVDKIAAAVTVLSPDESWEEWLDRKLLPEQEARASLRDDLQSGGDHALADVPGLLDDLDIPQLRELWPGGQVNLGGRRSGSSSRTSFCIGVGRPSRRKSRLFYQAPSRSVNAEGGVALVAVAGGAHGIDGVEVPDHDGGAEAPRGYPACMSRPATIRGARGIAYFTHRWQPDYQQFAPTAVMQQELKRLNVQITRLAPAVLAEPAKVEIEMKLAGDLPCHLMATEHEGATYVFAQNLDLGNNPEKLRQFDPISPRSGRAVFTVPGLAAGSRIEVLDEGRTIAAENNRFTDAFGPLGEHVYRIPAR
jgi:hypothetical protein